MVAPGASQLGTRDIDTLRAQASVLLLYASSLAGVPSGSWSYNQDDELSGETYDSNLLLSRNTVLAAVVPDGAICQVQGEGDPTFRKVRGPVMKPSVRSSIGRFAILAALGACGVAYILYLGPKSIPEWMTIPILLIVLVRVLQRSYSARRQFGKVDELIAVLLFGDGFLISHAHEGMSALTAALATLCGICIVSVVIHFFRTKRIPQVSGTEIGPQSGRPGS